MPTHNHPNPDDRTKVWFSRQIEDLQHHLGHITQPILATFNQVLVLLSYLNPFTYLFILTRFIHRLIVSPHTHRSILGSIILGLIFTISLLFSIIAYVAFYRTYIPQIGFSLPVWLQYGENRVPHATVDFVSLAPEITTDQAYDVHLHLTVPTNDRNMNMGNFMVYLAISTAPPHDTILHQSSRPASLVYAPGFARVLHGFKYLRTLFFCSSPPSVQHVQVPLLEHVIIKPSSLGKRNKIGYATIEVGRRDVHGSPNLLLQNQGWGELQVYRATLVFDAHLDGLRWILYYHPYISFFFFSALFFIAELVTILCTWAVVIYGKSSSNLYGSDSYAKDESPFEAPPDSNNEHESPKPGPLDLGMTEVDSSSASENDQRPLEGDPIPGDDPLLDSLPKIKTEVNDDGVLVGSSQPSSAGRSISSALGSLRSRKTPKTSERS